jgi:hypothetical protein
MWEDAIDPDMRAPEFAARLAASVDKNTLENERDLRESSRMISQAVILAALAGPVAILAWIMTRHPIWLHVPSLKVYWN